MTVVTSHDDALVEAMGKAARLAIAWDEFWESIRVLEQATARERSSHDSGEEGS